MRKSRVRDARLDAIAHVKRVDAGQVRKGRVRDARLVAILHLERVDAGQVRKGRVVQVFSSRHVRSDSHRKTRAPENQIARNSCENVAPWKIGNG